MIDLDELERNKLATLCDNCSEQEAISRHSIYVHSLLESADELIAMARRAAWVEANPDHYAMPYCLRGKWIVAGPLNVKDCRYRAYDTWAEAIDAAMQEQKP